MCTVFLLCVRDSCECLYYYTCRSSKVYMATMLLMWAIWHSSLTLYNKVSAPLYLNWTLPRHNMKPRAVLICLIHLLTWDILETIGSSGSQKIDCGKCTDCNFCILMPASVPPMWMMNACAYIKRVWFIQTRVYGCIYIYDVQWHNKYTRSSDCGKLLSSSPHCHQSFNHHHCLMCRKCSWNPLPCRTVSVWSSK